MFRLEWVELPQALSHIGEVEKAQVQDQVKKFGLSARGSSRFAQPGMVLLRPALEKQGSEDNRLQARRFPGRCYHLEYLVKGQYGDRGRSTELRNLHVHLDPL